MEKIKLILTPKRRKRKFVYKWYDNFLALKKGKPTKEKIVYIVC